MGVSSVILESAGSTTVAVLLGGILAFLTERTDLRFRHFIPAIVMVPLIMPIFRSFEP